MMEANAFGSDKDMFETSSRCSQEIGQTRAINPQQMNLNHY
jgi:hypothetical protein